MAASIIPERRGEPPLLSGTAMAWQDMLDRIDPFFGDPGELTVLLAAAPTAEAAGWLAAQIDSNRRFISRLGFR